MSAGADARKCKTGSESNPLVSCLIPAYNEGANIGRVLEAVLAAPCIHEIIILDDGSSDDTVEVVRKHQELSSAIKLIASGVNRGKTDIVRAGVQACRGEIVVMLDSDLLNLSVDNLRKLIAAVRDEAYDMAILDRAGDRRALWGWTDCARFFGGERAFRRSDFLEISFPARGGFLLEIIMNLHYIRTNKKMITIYCDNLFTIHHYDKLGVAEGFKHYWRISVDILTVSGVVNFLKQVYRIEEDRLARLYRWHRKRVLKPATYVLIPLAGLARGWCTFIRLNLFVRPARLRRKAGGPQVRE